MSKHTPGDWYVKDTPESSHQPCVVKSGREHVASLSWAGSDATTAANANLIAAAPELLEAARWAQLRLESFYSFYGVDDDPNRKAFSDLSAAIAKATGEA